MQDKKPFRRMFEWMIVGLEGVILFSHSSYALTPPSQLSNPQSSINCDDFCPQFVPKSTIDNPRKLAAGISSDLWSDQDDIFCASIGQATTTSYVNTTPSAAPSQTAACNNLTMSQPLLDKIRSTKGNLSDPNQLCMEAGKLKDRCLFHNSQVEPHCMTYSALTGDAGGGAIQLDTILMATDLGVAAVCATACATLNTGLMGFCSAAATGAGIAEATMVFTQLNGPVGKLINSHQTMMGLNYGSGMGGVAGAAGGVATGAVLFKKNAQKAATDTIEEGADDAAKKASQQGADDTTKNAKRAAACGTAVVFAALAGVRTASLLELTKAADNACKSVNDLFSQPATAGSSTPSSTRAAGTNPGGTTTNGNSSAAGAQSGNLSGLNPAQVAQFNSCLQANPQNTNSACMSAAGLTAPTMTGAADANLLTPSGNIGALLSPAGNIGELAKKALSEGAGAALESIMPSSAGNAGAALTAIANTAQSEAPNLLSQLHMGSSYSGGGSGGGGSKGSGSGSDSFASLFGGQGGGGAGSAGGGSSIANFGGGTLTQDIWHTGSKLTLFQIVSEKTWRVSNRVEKLEPRPFDPRE